MKAGVLGVVDGAFRVVDSFTETVEEDGRELERCLDVQSVFSLPSGETAFAGRAAREVLRERDAAEIAGGEVRVSAEPRKTTQHTSFVGVPGEFVVVDSGAGEFAFDMIARETNTGIERATLDLDGFFAEHGDARPWKAGFFGEGEDAVTGVLHGRDLREDHDLAGILERSRLNQVGLVYDRDGAEVKVTASRSGYVELYRPREFESADYLEYLGEELVPHVEESQD